MCTLLWRLFGHAVRDLLIFIAVLGLLASGTFTKLRLQGVSIPDHKTGWENWSTTPSGPPSEEGDPVPPPIKVVQPGDPELDDDYDRNPRLQL